MKNLIYKAIRYLKYIIIAIVQDVYSIYNKTYLLSQEEVEKREINYKYKGKTYKVKLPVIEPEKEVNIRLKKIKPNGKDLILKLFYNKRPVQHIEHWVDKNDLNLGYMGFLCIGGKSSNFSIDISNPFSDVILKNKGNLPTRTTIFFKNRQYRGDVVVKLMCYNSDILSGHTFVYNLTDHCLKEENRIFEKASAILKKEYNYINKVWGDNKKVHTDKVVEVYNKGGVQGVFCLFKEYLRIYECVKLSISSTISEPGRCMCKKISTVCQSIYSHTTYKTEYFEDYEIVINRKYINNPFFVASILAHELCHIVYNKYFYSTDNDTNGFYISNTWSTDCATSDMEQTVDILTFVLGLGEFRIRAKQYGVFLGYLQEPVFHNLFHFVNNNVKEIFNN